GHADCRRDAGEGGSLVVLKAEPMRKYFIVPFLFVSFRVSTSYAETDETPAEGPSVRGPKSAGEWRFDFHGFLRAPMRVGMAKRENAGPGQSRINFHEPRVPDDQYLSWLYTRNQERAWGEAFLSYGNGAVTGTLGVQAYNFTDATWNDQDAQL